MQSDGLPRLYDAIGQGLVIDACQFPAVSCDPPVSLDAEAVACCRIDINIRKFVVSLAEPSVVTLPEPSVVTLLEPNVVN